MLNCERCKSGYDVQEGMVRGSSWRDCGESQNKEGVVSRIYKVFLQTGKSINIAVAVGLFLLHVIVYANIKITFFNIKWRKKYFVYYKHLCRKISI
jgi:hypothetical protein